MNMPTNWHVQSIRAGAFIALGCILYLLAPNPIVGAVLFSLGLLSVRLTQSYLYTGQVHQLVEGDRKWWQMPWIWAGNLVGVALVLACIPLLGGTIDLLSDASLVGMEKLNMPYMELWVRSIFCGALMTMATRKDTPLWITSGCVAAFILSGFNHCIADAFYFWSSGESILVWLPALLIITAGNTIGGLLPVLGIPRK